MILELEARLRGTQEPVSRMLRIGSDATLADLHAVLQIAFNLDDVHRYLFEAADGRLCGEVDDEQAETGENPIFNAEDCVLEELLPLPGDTLAYSYDIDPSWEFDITAISVDSGPLPVPEVTEFEGPNLVDDVGGASGFEEFLAALRNPRHPKRAQYKAWIQVPHGVTVDQVLAPDLDTINAEINAYFTEADADELLAATGLSVNDLMRELQTDPSALRRRLLSLLGEDGEAATPMDAGLPDETLDDAGEEPGPQGGGPARDKRR